MRYLYYGIWLSIAISFLCIYSVGNAQTVNTGNVLSNSTFGTGNTTSTTGWSTDGSDGVHSHGAFSCIREIRARPSSVPLSIPAVAALTSLIT